MSEKRQISSIFKLNNDEIEALKTKYINDKKNEGTDVDHKNSAISAINDQQHLKPEQKSESISLYHQYESTESIPQTHLLTYDSDNDKAKKPVHRVSRTVLIILGCIIVVSGIILTLILFSGKNNDSVSPESTVSEITSESRAESEKSEVSENSEISNSNEITDIKLNKTEFTIGKGEVANLTPVFEPADSENKTITWSSSDSSIVNVSNGLISGVNNGTATITAESINGKTAECIVTVRNAPDTVKLSDDTVTINLGEKYSLRSILPDNSSSESRVYSSSDRNIIKITRNYWVGEFIGINPGVAYVTVRTYNGLEATCKVIVNDSGNNTIDYSDAVSDIKLNKDDISLGKGEIANLIPSIEPSDTEYNVITWTSSNPDVVEVSSGMIFGINTGTATITAETINGKTAQCTVTVKDEPSEVRLSEETITIKVGEKHTLTSVLPENTAAESRVYYTSDSSIVKMTRNYWVGEFEGLKAGTAYITVKTYNGMESTCKITVE